jgi:hypothetical protein
MTIHCRIVCASPWSTRCAAGLRTVLIAESGDLDWTDPEIVAPFVVTNVSDFLAAATQLTVMCCKAAGAIRRDLLEAAEKAYRDPAVWEDGRFDRWLDSASKSIGALARFQSPPVELTGRKRMPRESNVIFFRSEKLRRNVACDRCRIQSRCLRLCRGEPGLGGHERISGSGRIAGKRNVFPPAPRVSRPRL